jgi:hypothetical protein
MITCKVHFVQAQPFYPVGTGTDNVISCLYSNTPNGLLFVGGQFSQAGGISCSGISKWNNIFWDSLSNDIIANPHDIITFNNDLFVAGALATFDTSSGQWIFSALMKWDSTNYTWLRIDTPRTNGVVYDVLNYNNDLYISGQFDTIGGIYSSKIARYDGNNFYPFPTLDNSTGGFSITNMIFYNGELYVGGNFDSQIASNMKDIASWDGFQWQAVFNGLSGQFTWVNDFAIYQGKLIVAGWFRIAYGDPGNDIVAWDGSQWTQLGTGMTTGQIWDVEIYNGELWAGGAFYDAGGIPVTHLAKWNGTQWQSLGINLDNAVTSMAVLGNDLYIAGAFWTMNGDSVNHIIRYNSITGFQSLEPKTNEIKISPNPFSDKLNITTETNEPLEITLFDIASRKLLHQQFTNTLTLNTSHLSKGIYIYELRPVPFSSGNKNGVIKKGKVVKD